MILSNYPANYMNCTAMDIILSNLCNVVLETPDNIAQEKILFTVVLILLGQHCTGNCKNPAQCCLNITFWQFLFWTG